MQEFRRPAAAPAYETLPAANTRGKRRVGYTLLLIALAALAAFGWWRWSQPSQDVTSRRSAELGAPATVRAADVITGDMPVIIDGLGTVTSLATVTVKTQISGKIIEIGFTEGQAVKAGDFLLQIDPQPYKAALDQAEGQLARDQTTLAQAKVDLDRYSTLLKQDSIARQQVDTQRSLVHQTEAILRSDQAAIDTAKINLAYCRIVSPIAGRVGLRLVDLGNYVQPSDASGLVVVTQTEPISVVFSLPQDTIPQFLPKLRKGEKLDVIAYDRTGSQQLATGVLTTVDNQIDTTTGTVRLRATFANEDETLFPNQFVNVKLVADTQRGATLVPAAGVLLGAPGTYVYRVNSDNTVSMRPIKTGVSDAHHAVVLEGLSPGDKVVIDGADRLRDGAKIVIAPETPAAAEPQYGNVQAPANVHREDQKDRSSGPSETSKDAK